MLLLCTKTLFCEYCQIISILGYHLTYSDTAPPSQFAKVNQLPRAPSSDLSLQMYAGENKLIMA
jgi:hypothetical protein